MKKATLNTLYLYAGIIGAFGFIFLWAGDARIEQKTKPLSDLQIEHEIKIRNLQDTSKSHDAKLIRIENKIDKVMEILIEIKK